MFRLIGLLVVVAISVAAALGWDRRPAIDVSLPVPILHPHFRLAAGPVAQLPAAQAAEAAAVGSARAWEGYARAWKRNAAGEAANREAEQRQAVTSALAADKSCDARLAAARRSAFAIQSIMEAPHAIDQNGCPVRGLITGDVLRDATGAPTAAPFRGNPAP